MEISRAKKKHNLGFADDATSGGCEAAVPAAVVLEAPSPVPAAEVAEGSLTRRARLVSDTPLAR
jgi:hypothetical protein